MSLGHGRDSFKFFLKEPEVNFTFLMYLFLLFGCTSLSVDQCKNMDWSLQGQNDANLGRPASLLSNYVSQCRGHGLEVNQADYRAGHSRGLRSYCSYENGFELGHSGSDYSKICPETHSERFINGYAEGRRLFEEKESLEKMTQLEEKHRQKRAIFRERILGNMQNRKCSWNPDCLIEDKCIESQCRYTGAKCTFDSHCEIKGSCDQGLCRF